MVDFLKIIQSISVEAKNRCLDKKKKVRDLSKGTIGGEVMQNPTTVTNAEQSNGGNQDRLCFGEVG